MRTIDYTTSWIRRLEAAGFEFEFTTEEIIDDLAFVEIEATHETGEYISILLAVHDGRIDHNRTKFGNCWRIPASGSWAVSRPQSAKLRRQVSYMIDDAIRNADRVAARVTEEV